jgi:glycosyltransferase involved in cell wall biosynthesis
LVGNYPPDAQESMIRYAQLVHAGLTESGVDAHLAFPEAAVNVARRTARGLWKWIGYLDKYLVSVPALRREARRADIVHICDHSNSVYIPLARSVPHVVTCHDLLAVRGALGENTDCPASATGRLLQRSILRGLNRADALACVSSATYGDASRLLPDYEGEMLLAPNSLNYPYQPIDPDEARARLGSIPALAAGHPFVLNLGSSLRRKNREGVLESVALASSWGGLIVFAGQPLTPEQRGLATRLGLVDRIVEIQKPSNAVIEALYNTALALHFPSRFEGFGWPIIEAQACGCPVICSNQNPMAEISGGAALLCDVDDAEALARAICSVAGDVDLRQDLRQRGIQNASRFSRSEMIDRFSGLYRRLVA